MKHPLSQRIAFASTAIAGLAGASSAGADDMKETAVGILIEGIVNGDRSFIEEHVAEDYIQHNPNVAHGRAGLLALIDYLHSLDTKPQIAPLRVLQDGDLVAVHSEHVIGTEGVAFDLFRFENGVAMEHWDGIQPKPKTTVSGRSMTDGPAEIVDLDGTAANRALIVNFVEDILVGGKSDRITDYIGGTYLQHNPRVGDGLEGLGAFLEHLQATDISFSYGSIHNVVAEGNFVMTQSEGEIGGAPTAFYDLFRVEKGMIVEHWDVVQEVPTEMAHDNGMF